MQAENRHKRRRDSLIAKGMCCQCGKQIAVPGMVYCGYCQEYKTERNRHYYHFYMERGFCPRHRHVRAVEGKKHCQWCLEKDRERKRLAKHESPNSQEQRSSRKETRPSVL